jgi:hypothetical protein
MEEAMRRDWLTKSEAEAFIGKNNIYYLDKWKSHPDTYLKGWNWAAAIFSIEWMAYRRMYVEAATFFIIVSAVSVITGFVFSVLYIDVNGKILGDAFRIMAGILGNAMYRYKALRVLHKTNELVDSERLLKLQEKGGISILGLVICLVIEIIVTVMINLFF